MEWLSAGDVIRIHRRALDECGGTDGIRSRDLLESALARPMNVSLYEEDVDALRLAAILCEGIVKNHPFVDGNKRTAWWSLHAFLDRNGYRFTDLDETAGDVVLEIAEGNANADDLEEWLRDACEASRESVE